MGNTQTVLKVGDSLIIHFKSLGAAPIFYVLPQSVLGRFIQGQRQRIQVFTSVLGQKHAKEVSRQLRQSQVTWEEEEGDDEDSLDCESMDEKSEVDEEEELKISDPSPPTLEQIMRLEVPTTDSYESVSGGATLAVCFQRPDVAHIRDKETRAILENFLRQRRVVLLDPREFHNTVEFSWIKAAAGEIIHFYTFSGGESTINVLMSALQSFSDALAQSVYENGADPPPLIDFARSVFQKRFATARSPLWSMPEVKPPSMRISAEEVTGTPFKMAVGGVYLRTLTDIMQTASAIGAGGDFSMVRASDFIDALAPALLDPTTTTVENHRPKQAAQIGGVKDADAEEREVTVVVIKIPLEKYKVAMEALKSLLKLSD